MPGCRVYQLGVSSLKVLYHVGSRSDSEESCLCRVAASLFRAIFLVLFHMAQGSLEHGGKCFGQLLANHVDILPCPYTPKCNPCGSLWPPFFVSMPAYGPVAVALVVM